MNEWLGEEKKVCIGPHHPVTRGGMNFIAYLDGETLRQAIHEIGYCHRSLEKIAENTDYQGFTTYASQADPLSPYSCQWSYVMAVENLAEITVHRRAEFLRVIAMELNRITSHLHFLSFMAEIIGAKILKAQSFKRAEIFSHYTTTFCGNDNMFLQIGGVVRDLCSSDWETTLIQFLDHLKTFIDEYSYTLKNNYVFQRQLSFTGVISVEEAIQYNLVGPNLRASGLAWDLRKNRPYSIYSELNLEIPTCQRNKGDAHDRVQVRIDEIAQSASLIRQCLEKIPQGPIQCKITEPIKPKTGEIYNCIEGVRGDTGTYLVSNGTTQPHRLKLRTGSFSSLALLEKMGREIPLSDYLTLIASLDISPWEADR